MSRLPLTHATTDHLLTAHPCFTSVDEVERPHTDLTTCCDYSEEIVSHINRGCNMEWGGRTTLAQPWFLLYTPSWTESSVYKFQFVEPLPIHTSSWVPCQTIQNYQYIPELHHLDHGLYTLHPLVAPLKWIWNYFGQWDISCTSPHTYVPLVHT